MVDFSKAKSEDKIKILLGSLRRTGRNQAVEFPPIEVGGFMIKVRARDNPGARKWKYGPWTPNELDKLPRILELPEVEVHIYEKRPGTELLDRISPDKNKTFSNQTWANDFKWGTARVNTDKLVEIIRFIQVLDEMVAFI